MAARSYLTLRNLIVALVLHNGCRITAHPENEGTNSEISAQRFFSWEPCASEAHSLCRFKRNIDRVLGKTRVKRDSSGFCPDDWYTFGDKCYTIYGNRRSSWNEAYESCRSQNSNLVSIHSEEEQNFLKLLVVETRFNTWIGLRRSPNVHSNFNWKDNSPVNFSNWAEGEPNDYQRLEDCVQMHFSTFEVGEWNDVMCRIGSAYICERPKDTTLQQPGRLPGLCNVPFGWVKLRNSCYKVFHETGNYTSWLGAQSVCESYDGNLVHINDYTITLLMQYHLKDLEGPFWTGMRSTSKHKYTWLGRFPSVYSNWGNGEPKDLPVEQDCVAIDSDGKWIAMECEENHPFICEVNKDVSEVPTLETLHPNATCPTSSPKWHDLGGKYCYIIDIATKLTWNEASSRCSEEGGFLASFHSIAEVNTVVHYVRHHDAPLHIGFKRNFRGDFLWSDRSTVDFRNWEYGEPSSRSEECSTMFTTNGKWNDVLCSTPNGYVCSVRKAGLSDEDFDNQTDSIYDIISRDYLTTPPTEVDTETAVPEITLRRCFNKSEKWIDLGGDFCYIIEQRNQVRWIEAVRKCFEEGGSLISFHSNEEIKRILSYTKKKEGRLYIGLWKHNDGSLRWLDNSAVDFRRWNRGEPSYRDEKCVEIFTENGKWNDVYCGSTLGYICSSKKGQSPLRPEKICPDSSAKWRDFGGENCYIIETVNETNWNDALQRCISEGGSLATFPSVEEISLLVQHTSSYYDRLHIGLRENKDGEFEWVDKTPMDFLFWNAGEPNGVDERCGEMYPGGGEWNDIPCHKTEGYICSTRKVHIGISSLEVEPLPTAGDCGGNIISDDGTITSPNYPEDYNPNANCLWLLTVPEHYQVILDVQSMRVEYGSDCEFDYLEIADGHDPESTVIRKLCGSDEELTAVSSGNKMSVKFVSDKVKEDTGFTAVFTKVEACGGTIISQEGILRSRNHPETYWENDVCEWKIKVPDGYKILLTFHSFEVEDGPSCSNDYLEILDGQDTLSPSLGRFCGYRVPRDITSSGHKITVRFVTDGLKEYHGFSAEFSKVEIPLLTTTAPVIESSTLPEETCGGYFASEKGVILSPNYPNDYSSNQRCTWRIVVPEGFQVILRFKSFRLESESDCDYDYLKVFDGPGDYSPELGNFCGANIPDDITSTGNEMTLKFKSDSSGSYYGFAAIFTKGYTLEMSSYYEPYAEVLCGENIEAEEGLLQSPNYPENYEPNEKCIWRITVPKGYQVLLKFQSFNLEKHDRCFYDSVGVLNGHSSNGRVLAQLCGDVIPSDIRSAANKMMVIFKSDSTFEYNGFSATFEKVLVPVSAENVSDLQRGPCGGDISSESGVIYSPNYPETYPPLAECTWNIKVPEEKNIVLFFQHVDMEFHESCNFDYVEISEGNLTLNRLCRGVPSPVYSTGNMMTVKFVSDETIEGTGFYANFTIETPCGEEIFAEEGVIQSPNYPNSYGPGQRCVWKITVPEGNRVSLTFQTFELGSKDKCDDFVVVRYGLWEWDDVTAKYCSTIEESENIVSRGNTITIEFQSDGAVENKGFSAEFKKDSCGGDIHSESGSISSRNYPALYRRFESCIWNITVPKGYEILLEFEEFEVEGSSQCEYDVVEILDGLGSDSPRLARLCGSDVPEPIRSSTEHISVKFKTDNSVQYRGFFAKFSKVSSTESELISLMRQFPSIVQEEKTTNPKLQGQEKKKKPLESNLLNVLMRK